LVVPLWVIEHGIKIVVHAALFDPPTVAICKTRVAVVQFQPLPGQFGPA